MYLRDHVESFELSHETVNEDPRAEDAHEWAHAYVNSVLPEGSKWRNKVAAYYARHTPHKDDTPADTNAGRVK
jgi:hypothetical protein